MLIVKKSYLNRRADDPEFDFKTLQGKTEEYSIGKGNYVYGM